MKRAIVYYTDSRLDPELDCAVRKQLIKAANGIPIISVSQKPLDLGKNICIGDKPRCYRSLYEQLLIGLEEADPGSMITLVEHDVFYDLSHFRFYAPDSEHVYFNLNRYAWCPGFDTFGIMVGYRALSQAVADRELLLNNVTAHIARANGDEVGPHMCGTLKNWISPRPTVDIRHGNNFTEPGPYESEGAKGLYKIPFWGTPAEFSEKVGYG